MDDLTPALLTRLPLAQAVLWLWSFIAATARLDALFQEHRGRSYEKVFSFPVLVQLIADALLVYRGSARQSFEHARDADRLPASITAAYGKFRRLPAALSMAFLVECTEALAPFAADPPAVLLPERLRDWEVITLDGKAIKRVAKRLKALWGVAGGVLGGRALVAWRMKSGQVVAMHAHPDGDANDVRFVPLLCPMVRQRLRGPRLWVADRQFCNLVHLAELAADGDHFLVRYAKSVGFVRDPERPVRRGFDGQGRAYEEEWGWLGSATHKHRRYVRRITLERPGEEALILVTNLVDAKRYRAADLLEVYRERWGIERVFQQVTEVFGLERLLGSTPEATIFQFAFCLVLYNIIQVVRGYAAHAGRRPVAEISSEKLFGDVTRQLVAWYELQSPETTVACFAEVPPLAALRQRLKGLVKSCWGERWLKGPTKKRQTKRAKHGRVHGSVYRIMRAHKQHQAQQKSGP
jgi:Transposase DDE domain